MNECDLRRAIWAALVASIDSGRMKDAHQDNEFSVMWDMALAPLNEFIWNAVQRADEIWKTTGRDAALKSLATDRRIVENTLKWMFGYDSFIKATPNYANMNLALVTEAGYMEHRRWVV